jgi:hypothetical protein
VSGQVANQRSGEIIVAVDPAARSELGARERAAIGLAPEEAWQIAIDQRGEVRERRADGACADRSCAHAPCWIEEAHVTELTPTSRRSGRLLERPCLRRWKRSAQQYGVSLMRGLPR